MTETVGPTGPDRLSIICTTIGGMRVITPRGEVDHDTADSLHQALLSADRALPQRTVIDLGAVTFMDSSGINTLIAAHLAHSGGGWLRLAGPTEPVRRVLQIVGLDTVIDCYPTLHQALDA
ncbi:STAS domain-containing protein [Streptomyces sp. TP-A0356]|uniref:STAS domain-containing protein n=1 Tax=Streptomyces sp. TP-A0356 TaxID=1359208 RepID=UPI000B27D979|nr:STAS domain-containing protein [Streptomyces sp. TP-A0356]